MARVDGKVVVISGGARGMGAAHAEALVSEGTRVVIGQSSTTKAAESPRISVMQGVSSTWMSPIRINGTLPSMRH
jgi:NAD(P)-dependent dehydrogenase (short-subunit alcohol dehydrogenase family)